MDQENRLTEIERRLQTIENNRWIFPIRLSQIEKKSLNNAIFTFGTVTVPLGGTARATYPGLTPNMMVMATYSSGAPSSPIAYTIQASTIIPGQYEIAFYGDIGLSIDFIVFLTSNKLE